MRKRRGVCASSDSAAAAGLQSIQPQYRDSTELQSRDTLNPDRTFNIKYRYAVCE